ncbi:septal ring lytic transglycosylase RlpA family protein [Candidatus Methylacidiphilum fumarolicum]|uniref:Probable endolytic peptidoglycan transglycosylase RlpA n=3 Tax=Candidatus Methylacidiphilum fumarolicum TaxID=591154 RepID=I0JWE9_METFB|nr:septal ring lytic transglycosylase RlpA family protein [Candidatus Methylacidiphilum fumarolicum]MBW6415602.1 septal ring lytic transglycosylase RlpA family protein [Candidatus Methylacidiphilum fumarolicum]TFE66633.1 hypothetical protein A7K73_10235 [Candidatus Methylacidiphilum fumarolicum]TFE73375.1 septal ring lytic transglycosylase RlpA family protein [Candidatus Methylacidiphilum fumarolicum]TFE75426.1 septal ring lytic transglycosylase RlpA family protein [Candidatus Methylacidiphilum
MFFLFFLFSLFPFHKKAFSYMPTEVRLRGLASWYAEPGHVGRKFVKEHKFTAAHKTLPFGTYVEVHNLKNNRTVIVCIDDRGPFIKNRIIDLSKPAAEKLEMIHSGIVPVELKVIRYTAY